MCIPPLPQNVQTLAPLSLCLLVFDFSCVHTESAHLCPTSSHSQATEDYDAGHKGFNLQFQAESCTPVHLQFFFPVSMKFVWTTPF